MTYSVFVKNIVSKRFKQEVIEVFEAYGLEIFEIKKGGEILLLEQPSKEILFKLNKKLAPQGFALISDSRAKIVSKAKALLENLIINDELNIKLKLSGYLSQRLAYEYHYLSTLFSQVEGMTIEKFFIQIKIEKIKDLIETSEINFSEISYKFGYSSPAHLTNQFKKVSGMTPSQYKFSVNKRKAK